MPQIEDTAEGRRLKSAETEGWRRWGPYLAERQWGTVREDYSADGEAWAYFPHEDARSRAYRWGEDGIAGFSDDRQLWCLGLALWNGQDDILKERMFGLSNAQGNHGEDVKELYWYLDGTPTHSYMRMLYKYPQAAFPYQDLISENNRRKEQNNPEYELVDTGIFDDHCYFDITVDYAKAAPDDVLMRITVHNRGPNAAILHVLPQLWSRNTWAWKEGTPRPKLRLADDGGVEATRASIAPMRFASLQPAEFLFCENETNPKLFGAARPGYFKDGINDCVVGSDRAAVNPAKEGTKCAAWSRIEVDEGGTTILRFRLAPIDRPSIDDAAFDDVFARRIEEADAYYASLQDKIEEPDARLVQRQALAGMLWSKQYYFFDVRKWLKGDPAQPAPPPERRKGRNKDWEHLNNADIISMPDTWEYPWYASWDLAFQAITFALIDPEFAKEQLKLLTREWYMNANGQLPAYEWGFDDANPPVHGWATWRVYEMDKARTGKGDRVFLESVFHKLMLNFTWWVNRKDVGGRNVFQGGFLGLDNIGLFDRSKPLPIGGAISQADGTAWMAMYSLNLMRIALELALDNPVYEDIATKFFEHFLHIAKAMVDMGDGEGTEPIGLWDEEDQFYYDNLVLPEGERIPLRVRSLIGLIPLCAVEVLSMKVLDRFPAFAVRLNWMLKHRPDLAETVSHWSEPGKGNTMLLSLLRRHRMKAVLARMLDETEFLSENGVRSVSKVHETQPFILKRDDCEFVVPYEPRESGTGLYGGNSNWRGPVWMPINYLLVESLREFAEFYTPDFKVECPTGSGRMCSMDEIAEELAGRLKRLFLLKPDGTRPIQGKHALLGTDPTFRDLVLFHEYFHGETGEGLGASHQTGWSGVIALLLQPRPDWLRPEADRVPTDAAVQEKPAR